MKRRTALKISTAIISGALGILKTAQANTKQGDKMMKKHSGEPDGKPSILLVHGAWHGGWCWKFVADILRQQGFDVYTPTMTGLGERAHLKEPVPSLETHINDIVNVIDSNELDDIVLVGHSYGGMVITGVADQRKNRIKHVLYLDAAVPTNGQSMISQSPGSTPESITATTEALTQLAPDGVWMQTFPAVALGIPAESKALAEWVDRRMTPHPLRTWTDPISLANGGSDDLPRTYIHCVEPVLPQASFAAHAAIISKSDDWRYVELATGHDAMVTQPKRVAEEISKAAQI